MENVSSPIEIEYRTTAGRYHAAHFHPELEMLYILNGTATVIVDGIRSQLVQGDLIVIDSNQIHETQCRTSLMQIIIHVDAAYLKAMLDLPDGRSRMIRCSRSDLIDEQLGSYLELCDCFKELVPYYIRQPLGYRIECEAIVQDIIYRLIRDFSLPMRTDDFPELAKKNDRIKEILAFMEDHYAEPLSLRDTADHFGLSREYFSRYFRKHMGITYLDHLSRVRLSHIYHDLLLTDTPVMELMEKHGFTNYRLFNRLFKEIYGDTPRQIRKNR